MTGDDIAWSQRRPVALAAIVLATVPLLYPAIPPLTDMLGHIGGYRILAEAGQAPLAQHYAVHWAWIGNLGVEGLVLALHPLLDVAPAAHLVVAMVGGTPMQGDTGDWFDVAAKAQWIASLLRERWKVYDVACVIVLALVLWTAVRYPRLRFDPLLGVPALLGLAAFVLTPRLFAGGAYVDMRILPYAVALGLLAIRAEGEIARRLAIGGAAFFGLRLAMSTVALALFAQGQAAELAAVQHIPPGAAVLSLVAEPSTADWDNPRLGHVAGIAVARRRVFINEQWAIAGQQLIAPRHPAAAPFDRDPSQLVFPKGEPYAQTDFDSAVARFDRGTVGYVWTVGFAPGRAHARDLTPIWSNARSALYRVGRAF